MQSPTGNVNHQLNTMLSTPKDGKTSEIRGFEVEIDVANTDPTSVQSSAQ